MVKILLVVDVKKKGKNTPPPKRREREREGEHTITYGSDGRPPPPSEPDADAYNSEYFTLYKENEGGTPPPKGTLMLRAHLIFVLKWNKGRGKRTTSTQEKLLIQ